MLDNLRKEIDDIDAKIVNLIAKRIDVVKKIGEIKKQNNIQVVDCKRFEKVLEKVINLAIKHNMSEDFIKQIYTIIHDYMCSIEKEI